MQFDQFRTVPVVASSVEYIGKIWSIVKQTFKLADQEVTRDYLQHMGAVAVVAVNEKDEVLTIHQYRHPVAANLLEIPAGLLDYPEESPIEAAKRELKEETGYTANLWWTLCDFCTTPGSSTEAVRIFLAKDLTFEGFNSSILDDEESELDPKWIPVAQLMEAIARGEISSPTAVLGLTAYIALPPEKLRNADADWPMRENLTKSERIFRQE